ncbi:M12 family metallopeptidase [Aquimarina sp. W85]|uniref:M12 family metallopeptidase n=1 Tax=Aquimarina rhodophyticola TaxID=3342246 RepID=UPI003671A748
MKTKKMINVAKLGILTLGFLISSCSTESLDEPTEVIEQTDGEIEPTDQDLIKKFFNQEGVLVQPLDDETFLLDGDIIVTDQQVTNSKIEDNSDLPPNEATQRLGFYTGVSKWTNNTIVYVLENNLSTSVRNELFKSMDVWSNNTNVRFKERTNENNYVTIGSNGNTCNCGSANLGMNGSRGRINLGTRTTAVVIIHEIGHTLGYIHEQTRSDRDDHVRILFENIQAGAESQFRKNSNSQNIGEFDILSTMMYGAYTFSKNGQPTITRLDGSSYPRRQARLSAGDISGTNQVYPSDDTDGGGGDGSDICEGINEWSSNTRYTVGDKVTYQGYLYERDFNSWNQLGLCGAEEPADICDGINQWNRYTRYSAGNQVTYNGYLYTLLDTGRWSNEGRCGVN